MWEMLTYTAPYIHFYFLLNQNDISMTETQLSET